MNLPMKVNILYIYIYLYIGLVRPKSKNFGNDRKYATFFLASYSTFPEFGDFDRFFPVQILKTGEIRTNTTHIKYTTQIRDFRTSSGYLPCSTIGRKGNV